MTNFGWSLPPGCPSPRRNDVEFVCVNENCELFDSVREAPATWELGATFLHNDDDVLCPGCGWECMDPMDRVEWLETPEDHKLVDRYGTVHATLAKGEFSPAFTGERARHQREIRDGVWKEFGARRAT